MIDPFPMVPLAKNQGLGIALLSYAARDQLGLVGDFDLMYDLDDFANDLEESLASWRRRPVSSRRCTPTPPRRCGEGQARGMRARPGDRGQVQRLQASTRTVAEAATAVGCQEAEIAKSIVFVADGDPVVCVASGSTG